MSPTIFLGLWIFLVTISLSDATFYQTAAGRKQRRSVFQLSSMVNSVTGRKGTDFLSYGNWCGLGGSGKPVDPVDECCQIHDLCYNQIKKNVCKSAGEKGIYQVEYGWKKDKDGTAVCANDESDRCKGAVCACDAVLSSCLKENADYYDEHNLHHIGLLELMQKANWIGNE